jgi:hypothetical protein
MSRTGLQGMEIVAIKQQLPLVLSAKKLQKETLIAMTQI